jgi:transcriptional regulator with XRE-family HTH domain
MAQAFELILSNWLQSRGLSPEQAAPELGVGHVAIYAWLNGEYQPSNTKIPVLSRALQVPDDRLRAAIELSRRRRKTRKPR